MYGFNNTVQRKTNLPDNILERLQQSNLLTPASIFKTSYAKFKNLGFNSKEIELIRDAAVPSVLPKSYTAAESISAIPQRWKRIKCCCQSLDKLLANGIPTTGITEICGAAGSGKTQLCLQLAISVQLPEHLGGLGKGAVYISTESSLPTPRLCQIANHFTNYYMGQIHDIRFTDNIFLKDVYNASQLLECISDCLPNLMRQNSIGIIIIDSIAGPFRTENDCLNRAKNMRKLAHFLTKLSDEHHCAVVCTNQVTANINKSNQFSSDNNFVPCLGLAWANLVNTRLQIHKTNERLQLMENEVIPVRKMEILFAPDLKQDVAEFLITSSGVRDVHEF